MILDDGICTIYKITNTAAAGDMPNVTLVKLAERWFGDLDFASDSVQFTDSLEQIEISRKIRVLRCASVALKKTVVKIGPDQYTVERVWQGKDTDSGELISDLSLSRVVSAYDVS